LPEVNMSAYSSHSPYLQSCTDTVVVDRRFYKSRNEPVTSYDKVKFKQPSLVTKVMNISHQQICLTDYQD